MTNYLGCANKDINLTEHVDEPINEPFYYEAESTDEDYTNWEVVLNFGEKPFSYPGYYRGQLSNDVPHGYGEWIDHISEAYYENMSFAGDWENGKLHGKGTFSITIKERDGAVIKYEGEWAKGLWHGRGIYTSHDGFMIEALWENNDIVSITKTTDELVSPDIRGKINDLKRDNSYFYDPILNNYGLSRKEIIDKHKAPNRIMPYYYGLASWGGGLCDYYWYDDNRVLFGFIGSMKKDYFSFVDHILLLPGANFLGITLGETNISEISKILGEPDYIDNDSGLALYVVNSNKKESNRNDDIEIWFSIPENNNIPAFAEIKAKNLNFLFDDLQ